VSARYDFAVVGAGMVGATAACALGRLGKRVALIETSPADPSADNDDQYDLRVSAISPSSREFLLELDIWPGLDPDRICAYEQMQIWHENGSAQLSFDAVDLARNDLGTIVENRLLQHTLHRACDALASVDWYRPDRIEELLENDAERAVLRLESGALIEAQWVIAADGRGSPTRERAGLGADFGDYAQSAFVANVNTSQAHGNLAAQRFLATGPLAFLPLANGQSSIVWSCDNDLAERVAAAGDAEFCAMLGEAFEFRLGEVTATSPRARFPLGWHYCERWFEHRVLLAGDAAHGVHPLAGQGVNLGFSDVALLWRLVADNQGRLDPRLLRRYERRRKSETWLATQSLGALKWFYGLEHRPVTRLRDLGMHMIEQAPWLKRELMRKAVQNLS
jgi:2-octaprenylphenol hydroxylase